MWFWAFFILWDSWSSSAVEFHKGIFGMQCKVAFLDGELLWARFWLLIFWKLKREESALCHGQRVLIINFVFIWDALGDGWTLIEVFASGKGKSHYHDRGEIWACSFLYYVDYLEGEQWLYLVKRPAVSHGVFWFKFLVNSFLK